MKSEFRKRNKFPVLVNLHSTMHMCVFEQIHISFHFICFIYDIDIDMFLLLILWLISFSFESRMTRVNIKLRATRCIVNQFSYFSYLSLKMINVDVEVFDPKTGGNYLCH